MGEQQGAEGAPEAGGDKSGEKSFQAPATQEELDRIIGERLSRERSKFSDYDDLKTKAAKLAQLEDADKTEAQKAADALAAAQQRVKELEGSQLASTVAAAKGVPASLITGSTKEELERSADELLAWRGEKAASKPVVRKVGESPTKTNDKNGPMRDFVRGLFNREETE